MPRAYRGVSGREGCIWTLLILMGVAGQVTVMILLHPWQEQIQAWILAIGAVPFLAALALAVWVQGRRTKQRVQQIGEALTSQGLTFEGSLTDTIRGHLVPHVQLFEMPFGLQGGVNNLIWIAFTDEILVLEHSFITGSGRSTQEHFRTMVAFPSSASSPPGARLGAEDPLWLARLRIGQGRAIRRAHGDDLKTGDPSFDKAWAVYGSSETARQLLTAEVRRRLGESPRGEIWNLGTNWVACCAPLPLDSANLQRFLDHVRRILAEV